MNTPTTENARLPSAQDLQVGVGKTIAYDTIDHIGTPADTLKQIKEAPNNLQEYIGEESLLKERLEGREFATEQQLQMTIQNALKEIWEQGKEDGVLKYGMISSPESLQKANYDMQASLGELAKNIYDMIQPAIKTNQTSKQLEVKFTPETTEEITRELLRKVSSMRGANLLTPGEKNEPEEMALHQLEQAVDKSRFLLKQELEKTKFPSSVSFTQFKEGKVFKALETAILTSIFGFMTYGYHGIVYNSLDSAARNARSGAGGDAIGSASWAEGIMSDPTTQGIVTWGSGLIIATFLGSIIVKTASMTRNRVISDAEESNKQGKKVSTNAFKKWGPFAFASTLALGGAYLEGLGILSHKVKGVYTAQKAHEIGNYIHDVLDLKSPDSQAARIILQYQKAVSTIKVDAQNWHNAEINRPGASGEGPASTAKNYILRGASVLSDTDKNGNNQLDKKNSLKAAVESAENDLLKISPKSHAQNNTLSKKLTGAQNFLSYSMSNLDTLAWGSQDKAGVYQEVYKKRYDAESVDLFRANDAFQKQLNEFEKNSKYIDTQLKRIIEVYQNYINKVSTTSDRIYNSKTDFTLSVDIPALDIAAIREKTQQKPELEAKSLLGYWSELNNLVGKEGGIDTQEYYKVLILVIARSGLLELLGLAFLIAGIIQVKRNYSLENNLPSKKEEELQGHYDKLVQSIQNTFSGHNIPTSMPDLKHEEAEYLARRMITEINPSLEKWLPIHTEKNEVVPKGLKEGGRKVAGHMKTLLTGDTTTDKEKYLSQLNSAFVKLSKLAKKEGTIRLPSSEVDKIIKWIYPDTDILNDSTQKIANRFDSFAEKYANNLETLMKAVKLTSGKSILEREKDITKQREELLKWTKSKDWENMSTGLWNALNNEDNKNTRDDKAIEKISKQMEEMENFKQEIEAATKPDDSTIKEWKNKRGKIESDYRNLEGKHGKLPTWGSSGNSTDSSASLSPDINFSVGDFWNDDSKENTVNYTSTFTNPSTPTDTKEENNDIFSNLKQNAENLMNASKEKTQKGIAQLKKEKEEAEAALKKLDEEKRGVNSVTSSATDEVERIRLREKIKFLNASIQSAKSVIDSADKGGEEINESIEGLKQIQ